MEAGSLLRTFPLNSHTPSGHHLPSYRQFSRVSANLQGGYRGPRPKRELIADWVSNNDDSVRSIPIYVGGISLFGVLFNRTISGIAPVADASRLGVPHRLETGTYVAIYVGVSPFSTRALLERQYGAPHIFTWYQSSGSRSFGPPVV